MPTLPVAVSRALKAALPFPAGGWGSGVSWLRYGVRRSESLGGARDARIDVGDGSGTSIVESCVNWIMTAFPEAPPALWRRRADETRERIKTHPLLELIERPNFDPSIGRSWYSGTQLWMATLASYTVDGNAYWLKERAGRSGRVIRLWYVPHWMIEPKWPHDGSSYLSHYEYRPSGKSIEIAPNDVVHFRFGIDPENTRKGLSPLRAVLTDIGVDEEASAFTYALLRNGAVPGVIISPIDGESGPGPEEADALKLNFMRKFSGKHRGEPLVLEAPANVDTFGFSPEQMDLSALRNVAEERVTAALTMPAAVVGFGSGLHNANTNATYVELRLQAWENHLIPRGRLLATDVHDQLLSDFVAPSELHGLEFGFDLSKVRALQDDEDKKARRYAILFDSGGITRAELRSPFDLETTTADEVFKMKMSEELVPRENDVRDEPEPVVPALGAGGPLALPAGAPTPAEAEAAEQAKSFRAALQELRVSVLKLAAGDRKSEPDVVNLLVGYERAAATRDAALVASLTKLADAVRERDREPKIVTT